MGTELQILYRLWPNRNAVDHNRQRESERENNKFELGNGNWLNLHVRIAAPRTTQMARFDCTETE
jgi:hypothetical protein